MCEWILSFSGALKIRAEIELSEHPNQLSRLIRQMNSDYIVYSLTLPTITDEYELVPRDTFNHLFHCFFSEARTTKITVLVRIH